MSLPRPRSISVSLALATALALLATGCGAGSPAATPEPPADALVVYNAQHEQLTEEWVKAFTAETGIEVVLRNGSDSELGNQLIAEGDAARADVFLTENSPAMSLVETAGLFAPVDAATLALVPEQYRPSTGLWTGIAARSTAFVYNPELLDESDLPTSILDLAEPEWKGRWGAAPGGADFQSIVSAMLDLTGEADTAQWLEGMATNAEIYRNNIVTMKAVNDGEVEGGIIFHYYWFRDQNGARETSQNTELHYFGNQDPGAFVSVSGGGVLKSSTNQDDGQKFLAFLAGESGQTILGEGYSFEHPVASGIASRAPLPQLAELDAPAVDPSSLDGLKVIELMTDAGLL